MKIIDYENTKGTFKIKYLEDGEIITGSINIDSTSMNIEAVVAKLIINNSIGDIIVVEDEKTYKFEIVEKNMDIHYIEISEFDYFQQFKTYNERVKGIESKFVNVSEKVSTNEDEILFQYYYKSAEANEPGTTSYILKNYFSKGSRISDDLSPEGYFKEFDFLVRTFKTSFLANHGLELSNYYLCSINKTNSFGIDTVDELIKEITKRDVRHDLNALIKKDLSYIKGKNIILIADIVNKGILLKKYKNLLKQNGAKDVIIYSFAKSSCYLED